MKCSVRLNLENRTLRVFVFCKIEAKLDGLD